MDEEPLQQLKELARAATPAELSVLEAALTDLDPDRPTLLTTAPGSANERLWAQMCELGWMSTADALDVPMATRVFAVNFAAREAIRDFLADHARAVAMTAIINEYRAQLPPQLLAAVRGADGTPASLAILLGAIVEGTMRHAIQPELHDEFLREVLKVAEGLRSG